MSTTAEERLIQRLVTAARGDDRVTALLLYGSRASGGWDDHSDVDVGLVTTDEAYDGVVAGGRDLVAALGRPLLLESFGDPAHLHTILADGAELELMIQRESDLTLALPHRVLVDKVGVVERNASHASPEVEPSADRDEVRRLFEGFWHDVGHVATALARRQLWWAYGQLEQLRGVCLHLARLDAGVPLEDGEPYWKVDEALEADELGRLADTVVPLELSAMRSAALALIDVYRELARRLATRHGLPYLAELDALVTKRLRELEIEN